MRMITHGSPKTSDGRNRSYFQEVERYRRRLGFVLNVGNDAGMLSLRQCFRHNHGQLAAPSQCTEESCQDRQGYFLHAAFSYRLWSTNRGRAPT